MCLKVSSAHKYCCYIRYCWLRTGAGQAARPLRLLASGVLAVIIKVLLNCIFLAQQFSLSLSFRTGEYSCLRAELNLKRSIGHHLVQSYLPSTLIVVISWVSFWLDVDAIPARITLGVTTLLTISSESSDHQANLAPVSYVKALDVWMGTCTMFVFAAVLEFTFVSYLARKKLMVPATIGDIEASQDLMLTVVSINF